jgi:hypothetical protein
LTEDMPEKLLFETMVFDDEEGTEWLGLIALHPETRKWLIQVILKDGDSVLRKRIDRENEK